MQQLASRQHSPHHSHSLAPGACDKLKLEQIGKGRTLAALRQAPTYDWIFAIERFVVTVPAQMILAVAIQVEQAAIECCPGNGLHPRLP